jgi:hypothetical protein
MRFFRGVIAVLGVAGCAPKAGHLAAAPGVDPTVAVVALDPALRPALVLAGVDLARPAHGGLAVAVRVGAPGGPVEVAGRVVFLDAGGAPLAATAVGPAAIGPGAPARFSAESGAPESAAFRLELWRPGFGPGEALAR